MRLVEAWEDRCVCCGKHGCTTYQVNSCRDEFLREQDARIESEKAEAVRAEVLKVLDEIRNCPGGRESIMQHLIVIQSHYEGEK